MLSQAVIVQKTGRPDFKTTAMKRLLITILTIVTAAVCNAQISTVTLKEGKVVKYGLATFEVTLTGNWENPYLQEEAALDMTLTSLKECSNYRTVALISHTSKVMLKVLQSRL